MKSILKIISFLIVLILSLIVVKVAFLGEDYDNYAIEQYLFKPKFVQQKDIQLTYLGTSSFIITYKGRKLITDPFFSNPSIIKGGIGIIDYPSLSAHISRDKYANADMIVISHGHYDHCLDIQNFLATTHSTKLICEQHNWNQIAAVQKHFPIDLDTVLLGWKYSRDSTFRVYPIKATHSPHVAGITLCTGKQLTAQPTFPKYLYDWKLNQCFSYLIDVLENDSIVCRMLFICGNITKEGYAFIAKEQQYQKVAILMHIFWKESECMQNLYNCIEITQPEYVLLHHWNNFLKKSEVDLEILRDAHFDDILKELNQSTTEANYMLPYSTVNF